MDANNEESENSEIFLELAHKAVVGEADKLLTLAKRLRIPLDLDKVHQYLNAVRAVKPNGHANSMETREMIDFGVQTEDIMDKWPKEAVHSAKDNTILLNDFVVLGNNLSEENEQGATCSTDNIEDKTVFHEISIDEKEDKLQELCIADANTENGVKPKHIEDKSIASDIIPQFDIPQNMDNNITEDISVPDTKMLITETEDDNTEDDGSDVQNNNDSRLVKSTVEPLNKMDTYKEQFNNFQENVKESSSKGSPIFTKSSAPDDNAKDNSESKIDAEKQIKNENFSDESLNFSNENDEELKSKENEVKKQTISIPNIVKPKNYRSLPREEVTVKGNAEDVSKCIDIAENAIAQDNFIKAERILMKAERIYPTGAAKKLLQHIRMIKESNTAVRIIPIQIEDRGSICRGSFVPPQTDESRKLREDAPTGNLKIIPIEIEKQIDTKDQFGKYTRSIPLKTFEASKILKDASKAFSEQKYYQPEALGTKSIRNKPLENELTGKQHDTKSGTKAGISTETSKVNFHAGVEKCIKVAMDAISSGDLNNAKKFLENAQRIEPTEKAQALLDDIQHNIKQVDENEVKAGKLVSLAMQAIDDEDFDFAGMLLTYAWIKHKSKSAKQLLDQLKTIQVQATAVNDKKKTTKRQHIISTVEQQKKYAEKYYKLAERMMSDGNLEEAEVILIIALNTYPQNKALLSQIRDKLYSRNSHGTEKLQSHQKH